MPKLLILDFDLTFVSPHTFHMLEQLQDEFEDQLARSATSEELDFEIASFVLSCLTSSDIKDRRIWINNPEMLQKIISYALKNGIQIAICSFNPYVAAIKTTLELLLGKEQADKVMIIAIPEQKQDGMGKIPHIKAAINIANKRSGSSVDEVCVVDDDPEVLAKLNECAEQELTPFGITKYATVLAPKDHPKPTSSQAFTSPTVMAVPQYIRAMQAFLTGMLELTPIKVTPPRRDTDSPPLLTSGSSGGSRPPPTTSRKPKPYQGATPPAKPLFGAGAHSTLSSRRLFGDDDSDDDTTPRGGSPGLTG